MNEKNYETRNGQEELYLAPETNETTTEIPELRSENRKVFSMSDGTTKAVYYPGIIHVFDKETGGFEEVDNTLTLEEGGRHYLSGRGHFMARFSCEEEKDELFTVEQGMHRITVSAQKNRKEQSKGLSIRLHKKEEAVPEKSDTLIFEEIKAGTDLEYSVTAEGIKENIIVRQKSDVYRYAFRLQCENVKVQFHEKEKRVAFLSNETGKEVFYIPAPFMTDAGGNVSTGVSYEVKTASDGSIRLTVTADSDWLNAEERVFPVTIDPQVMVSGSNSMITCSWNGGNLYGSTSHKVGTTGNGDKSNNAYRMYMGFTMPVLPRNPRIKKAELKFYQSGMETECGRNPKFGLYEVNGDIVAESLAPEHAQQLIDFDRMKQKESNETVSYAFDVTRFVDKVCNEML